MIDGYFIDFDYVKIPDDAWQVYRRLFLLGEKSTIEPRRFLSEIGQREEDPKAWLTLRLKELENRFFKIRHGPDYSFLPLLESYTWDEEKGVFYIQFSPLIFHDNKVIN